MEGRSGVWDEEDMNGYQLLNEVGSGGTLSSLFTILSLFTENVKISWKDGESPDDLTEAEPTPHGSEQPRNRPRRSDSDVSQLNLNFNAPRPRGGSVSSSGSTVHAADAAYVTSPRSMASSPIDVSFSNTSSGRARTTRRHTGEAHASSHYGVVARATEDSTLAVIPAEAFRRLTKKFPKATAHIVQGTYCLSHCFIRLTNMYE